MQSMMVKCRISSCRVFFVDFPTAAINKHPKLSSYTTVATCYAMRSSFSLNWMHNASFPASDKA